MYKSCENIDFTVIEYMCYSLLQGFGTIQSIISISDSVVLLSELLDSSFDRVLVGL